MLQVQQIALAGLAGRTGPELRGWNALGLNACLKLGLALFCHGLPLAAEAPRLLMAGNTGYGALNLI